MEDAHKPPDPDGPAAPDSGTEAVPPAPVVPGAPTGRAVWWEVAAVLAVSVVPAVTVGVVALCDPLPARAEPAPYWVDGFYLSVLGGCTILVTLYLMSRSGESWANYGLAPPRTLDAPLGAFMLVVALVVWSRVPPVPDFGPWASGPVSRPRGAGDHTLLVVKYAIAGFAEELVTRGYLITRLKVLLRSRGEAVLFSALLFASCHVYQGTVGVVHSFVFGVTYGAIFLVIGRVWPLALGHALYNIRIELLAG